MFGILNIIESFRVFFLKVYEKMESEHKNKLNAKTINNPGEYRK